MQYWHKLFKFDANISPNLSQIALKKIRCQKWVGTKMHKCLVGIQWVIFLISQIRPKKGKYVYCSEHKTSCFALLDRYSPCLVSDEVFFHYHPYKIFNLTFHDWFLIKNLHLSLILIRFLKNRFKVVKYFYTVKTALV